MNQLVDVDYVKTVTDLNPQKKTKDFDRFIRAAQIEDLRPLLKDRLFFDLLKDASATANGSYPNLVDSYDYTWSGDTYSHFGLKMVLAHFAYARYRYAGQEQDTALGTQYLEGQNMTRPSESRNQGMYQYHRNLAFSSWETVKKFLDRNSDEYTLWNGSEAVPEEYGGVVLNRVSVR